MTTLLYAGPPPRAQKDRLFQAHADGLLRHGSAGQNGPSR